MNLRILTIGLSSIVLLGMIAFLFVSLAPHHGFAKVVWGTLFFLVFCGFPPVVSIMLSARSKNPFSHVLILTSSLLYGTWFAYFIYDAMFVNRDPQSGLALLVVGIYSLPVLLPLWITAVLLNRYYVKQSEMQSVDGENEVQ